MERKATIATSFLIVTALLGAGWLLYVDFERDVPRGSSGLVDAVASERPAKKALMPPEGFAWAPTSPPSIPASPIESKSTRSAAAQPVALPPAPTREAAHPEPTAPRINTRWSKPGMCSSAGPILQARQALLNSFRGVYHHAIEALVAPDVNDVTFMAIAEALEQVVSETAALAEMPIDAPHLVIYATLDDLRRTACVHPATVAYYDGSLHVSADVDLPMVRQSLQHEIVHHALASRGVQGPMWLQEGLAMYNARELWWADPSYGLLSWGLRYHHPFSRMVQGFPPTASEAAATAVYFQSIMMVQTVMDAGTYQQAWRLVEALANGSVSPDDAFAWGVQTADPRQQEQRWRTTVRAVVAAALGPGYTIDVD